LGLWESSRSQPGKGNSENTAATRNLCSGVPTGDRRMSGINKTTGELLRVLVRIKGWKTSEARLQHQLGKTLRNKITGERGTSRRVNAVRFLCCVAYYGGKFKERAIRTIPVRGVVTTTRQNCGEKRKVSATSRGGRTSRRRRETQKRGTI